MQNARMSRVSADEGRMARRRIRLLLWGALILNLVEAGVALAQPPGEATNGLAPSPFVEPEAEFPADPAAPLTLSETIAQSLFGPLHPERWRPLGLSNLFSEGWDEPYAPAPDLAGEGAPRQTWIGSADGAFYRLFVFSFSYARGLPGNTDGYNGSYLMFTPLSRRFELGWFVPFVVSAPDTLRPNARSYWTDTGDLTIAPRVLLAEDERYAITSNLFIRTPTGSIRNGNGAASLSPDVEFWVNPGKRWVFRGALGATVPTNETPGRLPILAQSPFSGFNAAPSALTSFDARLAIGHYITERDARFLPDFVWSLSTNLHTAVSGGNATYFSLTPAFRFGIGNNWYFLGGLEIPVVGPLAFRTQTTFQLIKNF